MAKKQPTKRKKKSGGTMMGMRAGFKRAAGTGAKRRARKEELTFFRVLSWVMIVVLLFLFVWVMRR